MIRTALKYVALVAVIIIGAAPLVYFAKVQLGIAQDEPVTTTPGILVDPKDPLGRQVQNNAFGVGEKIQYDINYGFINAGTATMEVVDLIEYKDRPAYQLVTTAQSNKFFSSFFPVRDRVESITDAIGLFSWRFDKQLREGDYRSHLQYEFDQVNHTVVYKGDTIGVPRFVQDALSVLYFVRTQPLEVGNSIFIDNFVDGKNYPLEVKVLRREEVDIKAGKFNCIVVEPLLRSAGIFKHEGRLTVWLTDDMLRLPVVMKSKIVVGSITVEATDYRLGELIEF
jgi:hypothetical protein